MSKKINKILQQNHFEQSQKDLRELLDSRLLLNTRAGKLLKKNKPFIVVAIDEEYYPQVYRLIRLHEKQKGRWESEDESNFQTALQMWFDFYAG
jgi:hypothetical protein